MPLSVWLTQEKTRGNFMSDIVYRLRSYAAEIDRRLDGDLLYSLGIQKTSLILKEAANEIERLEKLGFTIALEKNELITEGKRLKKEYNRCFQQALAEASMKKRHIAVMKWASEEVSPEDVYIALHDEDKFEDLYELWDDSLTKAGKH